MNYKYFYFSLLIFICNFSVAQTHIVDSVDNTPIPFVHIISNKGIIIGTLWYSPKIGQEVKI